VRRRGGCDESVTVEQVPVRGRCGAGHRGGRRRRAKLPRQTGNPVRGFPRRLGQQFIVINRDGAAGVIAAGAVAKMKPDGYSLLRGASGMLAAAPVFNRNTPYDTLKDFAPISIYCYNPYVTVVHPSVPAKNLRELLALAKAQPGKLSFGSSGVGGALHLATELMLSMSGTSMLHVPYRGTPALLLDLMSGQIDLVTTGTAMVVPHIQTGRLRPIGVTGSRRSSQLPDVPTIAEGGLPGYELVGWYGIVAPAGTPREVIATLHRNFVRALDHSSVKASIGAEGAQAGGNTPEEFAAFIRTEIDKYAGIIKAARLTPGS
jgi:tripartite-type tricarboxylate transporter receptor subunit TctC